MRNQLRFISFVLVLTALSSAALVAQSSTVLGTITSRGGQPAANVFVSIADRYRYTDVSGRYKIDGVPQGRQHMVVKRAANVLWEGDVTISGATVMLNREVP